MSVIFTFSKHPMNIFVSSNVDTQAKMATLAQAYLEQDAAVAHEHAGDAAWAPAISTDIAHPAMAPLHQERAAVLQDNASQGRAAEVHRQTVVRGSRFGGS